MKKALIMAAVFAATVIGFNPPLAIGVLAGQSVTVCHVNDAGTYAPVVVVLATADDASRVGGHVNDAGDIYPPFTWSGEYTDLNVPGANWLMQKTVTYRYYYARQWHTVTTVLWVANPTTQAIYNNGCTA